MRNLIVITTLFLVAQFSFAQKPALSYKIIHSMHSGSEVWAKDSGTILVNPGYIYVTTSEDYFTVKVDCNGVEEFDKKGNPQIMWNALTVMSGDSEHSAIGRVTFFENDRVIFHFRVRGIDSAYHCEELK